MRRGRNKIGVRHRAGMQTRGHQTCDMRHIHEEERAGGLGDFRDARKVDDARVGAGAGNDHFGLMFAR